MLLPAYLMVSRMHVGVHHLLIWFQNVLKMTVLTTPPPIPGKNIFPVMLNDLNGFEHLGLSNLSPLLFTIFRSRFWRLDHKCFTTDHITVGGDGTFVI